MNKKRIKVRQTFETVTIAASDATGTYRVTWHRTDGPHEEFEVTPGDEESVDEAVARDLQARLGP
jgi:hypothetical protein